ncbi:hypothetical protein [Pseudomonas oryzae]|uniref:DUF305 domain-containing protein n=1 Tax=Pseudomonas oryzae TaxID=1392877 RepID=A0A1H1SYW6_9PSED|nr:hypothetical protein [Pseudomonas oryzae]SDS53088.1 hypothetical protein SAMN05216221_2023 [Pseudomonas oryzae]
MNTYGRFVRSLLAGGLVVGLVACAQQPPAPSAPGTAAAGDWQQRCGLMQQQCLAMGAANTPEERQKLMEQHWQLMQENHMAMGTCPMGMMGAGMGPGMMHDQGMGPGMGTMGPGMGPMAGSLTAEQLDQRILHVEAMLKQLKEQRARMGK